MASLPCEMPMNINISAYRVLFILLMLVRYRSLNMMELNRLLSENPVIGRVYNCETLTKYINTLREVGCQIPRSSSRNDYSYELTKTPFPLNLEEGEMVVADKLLRLLAGHSDEGLYQDYCNFLEQLAWSVEDAGLGNPDDMEVKPIFPELQKRRELVNTYRRYCQDAFMLEIHLNHGGADALLYVEPHEVIERDKRVWLIGYEQQSQQQMSLDVQQIGHLKQMPSKNRRLVSHTSVVFALYGRLAASYRLYPGEKVTYRTQNEVHVKTKVSETDGLMSRLMKYGESCQVLQPESFRDAMRRHIHQLLATLQTALPAEV